jgi:uncharacterized membrane protein
MDIKRLIVGTIVGGITLHVVGYLIFDIAAANFYAANRGPISEAFRDAPVQWALALANLLFAALFTLGIASRGEAPTVPTGFVVGAVIGFLGWAHFDLINYAYTNVRPLTLVIVDPLLEIVHAGISGAVIAAVLARVPKSAVIRAAE